MWFPVYPWNLGTLTDHSVHNYKSHCNTAFINIRKAWPIALSLMGTTFKRTIMTYNKGKHIFHYRLSPETFQYALVLEQWLILHTVLKTFIQIHGSGSFFKFCSTVRSLMKINWEEKENAKVRYSLPNWITECQGKLSVHAKASVLDTGERLASHSTPFTPAGVASNSWIWKFIRIGEWRKNPCPWQELNLPLFSYPSWLDDRRHWKGIFYKLLCQINFVKLPTYWRKN